MVKRYKILFLVLFCTLFPSFVLAATPPAQPSNTEPGGSGRYIYTGTKASYSDGSRANKVWWYEPRTAGGGKPTGSLPAIVIQHGTMWVGVNPSTYMDVIDHFVKQGIIVIYPEYQSALTMPTSYVKLAGQNVKRCLDKIAASPSTYVQVNTAKMGYIGHSQGGCNTAHLASTYATYGLTKPIFAVGIYAAGTPYNASTVAATPSGVAVVCISVDGDYMASDRMSSKWFKEVTLVPDDEKVWIHINTESYSGGKTSGGHFSVLSVDDAVDWFGILRIIDGLFDFKIQLFNGAAFGKKFCLVSNPATYNWATDCADPNGLAWMGLWSDGHVHSPKEVHYMNGLTENGGETGENAIQLEGFSVFDPNNLNDGVGQTKAITAVGSRLGDYILIGPPYDLQGITHNAYVSVDGTISLRLQNETGGAIDLGSGVWYWRVMRQY